MLPHLDPDAVRAALDRFDTEFRSSDEWKSDGRQRYAIAVDGRLYPPKRIVALILGRASGFGSVEARQRLREVGFDSAELPPEQGWAEFIRWAKRIAESSGNIAEEKNYKLEIIENVGRARTAYLEGDPEWPTLLGKAFGPPNNLTPWRIRHDFLNWHSEQPEEASAALAALWRTEGEVGQRIDAFCSALPDRLISRLLRVTLASFLLMSEDPENLPIYRATPIERGYKLTGFPLLPSDAGPGAVYEHALDFFDRFIEEAEAAGLALSDRLEAQGAIWSVVSSGLEEEAFASWPEEEREALRRFRGEQAVGPYWWVNQGSTFRQESTGGYVWAPQRNSAGTQLAHHANVSRLKKGDQIVHYSNGAIRAVGTVLEDAEDGDRPPELPSGPWETDGRLARVEYKLLDEPVSLTSIPKEMRILESNPFDTNGNVRQGYMYPISPEFWGFLAPLVGQSSPIVEPLLLVGAQGNPAGAASTVARIRESLERWGSEADWWSYPLQQQQEEALEKHPYLYLYVSQPTAKITHRLHLKEWQTRPGSEGMESPWPNVTPDEFVGRTRLGAAQNEIFKTWFLTDEVEELSEQHGAEHFVTAAGGPAVPQALLNGFGLWRRKAASAPARSWIFQANPTVYDLRSAARTLPEISWTVRQHVGSVHIGDRVFLWESGSAGGVVATAEVVSEPAQGADEDGESEFTLQPERFQSDEPRVMLKIEKTLALPLKRSVVQEDPLLRSMLIFRAPQQTNFPLTEAEADELARLVAGEAVFFEPLTIERLAEMTHLDVGELRDIESLLSEKKQIILEGPPGSGKTFVARLFARYFTGNPLEGRTNHCVEVVQFHQSYGYEDFIQGIRPSTSLDGTLRYDLQPGTFKALCETAAANPAKRFVLIIDEINRGNISRIFGELLYLLEYRDEAVRLGNGAGEASLFSIPENVFLLGTMNTTDRSLSQIDYALRRRFFFYRLMPTVRGTAPILTSWLRAQGVSDADRQRLVGLFIALNDRIVHELGEHFQIGHSYLMRSGIERAEVLEQVWQRGVLPLLEEYFHNRKNLTEFLDGFRISRLEGHAEPND